MSSETVNRPGASTPTAEAAKTTKPRARWGRRILLAILLVVVVAAFIVWQRGSNASAGAVAGAAKGQKKGAAATPVVAARARKGNIGVYYPGLGAVTPIYTVTVKSRVDGQLMSVNYKEGDLVKKDDLLLEIDPRPYQAALDQAEGQLLKDQATLDNARVDLARYEKLLKQNAIQEQIYATQIATVHQVEGTVKTDQGVIDMDKLNLTYCKITSPLTGRIGLRLVDPGNIVHASDTNGLLVITQIQPISALFTLAEDRLPVVLRKLNAGQHLEADAYDRADHQKLATGTLASVDNQIDPSTGTLRLRAVFDNNDDALFPNQFVNVHLLVEEKSGITLIPTAAIQRTSTTEYVWVVKDDSTVTDRTITEGVTQGDVTEITSGVAPGEVVVMTGVDRLIEGAPVRAQIADEQPAAAPGQPAAKSGGKKK
ncbi:MAG TPA: MdtA/MuxA family multidrug efflux RND transporter periplasmic adaptor subunit [Terracidiphilus sp.]|nr:MdtA/MuxA family multidrug efflux RND transporter periplasmic adaptor subunit [Terracidiphilus sp.]